MNLLIIILMVIAIVWERLLLPQYKRQTLTSPLCIFLLFWILVLTLDALSLFEKPEIVPKTFLIIGIGIFSFFFGYKFGNHTSIRQGIFQKNNGRANNIILYFLTTIAIIAFITTFRSMLGNVLAGATLGANKSLLITGESSLGFNYVYIFKPIRILMTFIAASRVSELKNNKGIVISSVILMAMDFISMAGKTIIVDFAICVIVLYLQDKKDSKVTIKSKRPLLIGGAALVGILLFMNSYMTNAARSLYFYICGCVPFMNNAVLNIDNYYTRKTYGATSLYGFFRITEQFTSIIGISFGHLTENALGYLNQLEKAIHFSSDFIYNAFCSSFFYFYLDGRLWGVIFGMFIFGYISSHIYRKYVCTNSEYYAVHYAFIILLAVHSASKSLFTSISYAIAYILILIIYRIKITFSKEV